MARERHQTIGPMGLALYLENHLLPGNGCHYHKRSMRSSSTFSTLDGENFVRLFSCLSMFERLIVVCFYIFQKLVEVEFHINSMLKFTFKQRKHAMNMPAYSTRQLVILKSYSTNNSALHIMKH